MEKQSKTVQDANADGIDNLKLKRVLVVISPDCVNPGELQESALILRAISLAKATGCELELLHICYDDSLTPAFFSNQEEFNRAKEEHLDREATLLGELVARLNTEGVKLRYDTRWDTPRTDAILRKIAETKPDLVMKQSRESGYVIGLLANTDWDLIRQSPAHLWFVTGDGGGNIDRLITAVGINGDDKDTFAAIDYDVFKMANLIADSYGADNFPVHAYQVPTVPGGFFVAYAPEFSGGAPSSARSAVIEKVRQETAKRHGASIEAFAQYFGLDSARVHIEEGKPADVLPQVAESLQSNLIVMAAHNLSRWQRLTSSVTAEPVLANAPCDVLFVKSAREGSIPHADSPVKLGTPAYDLENAIIDPHRVFGDPEALVQATEISAPLRQRILQVWERDIRAQIAFENEGGSVQTTDMDILDAIVIAKARIEVELEHGSDERLSLIAI